MHYEFVHAYPVYTIRDAAKPSDDETTFRTFRHHAPKTIRLLLVPILMKKHFSLIVLHRRDGNITAYHINPSSGAHTQLAYAMLAEHLVPIVNTKWPEYEPPISVSHVPYFPLQEERHSCGLHTIRNILTIAQLYKKMGPDRIAQDLMSLGFPTTDMPTYRRQLHEYLANAKKAYHARRRSQIGFPPNQSSTPDPISVPTAIPQT